MYVDVLKRDVVSEVGAYSIFFLDNIRVTKSYLWVHFCDY